MLTIEQRFKQQQTAAIIPDQIILHSLANSWNFEGGVGWLTSTTNALESHYAVRRDGFIVQLVPETQRADANYKANRRANGHGAISIETDSDKPAVEPWTDAQVDAIVELCTDICRRYDIPPRLCPAWDQPGIGWHIMFGTPGQWTPVAKSCPGPARIRQVVDVILPRVRSAVTVGIPEGKPPAPPIVEKPAPPTPEPTPVEEDDDMPYTGDEIRTMVAQAMLSKDGQAAIRKQVNDGVIEVAEKQGFVTLANFERTGPQVQKWVQQEVLNVVVRQGLSGAGDFNRLKEVLLPAIVESFNTHGIASDATAQLADDVISKLAERLAT